jgi:putative transposase
MQKSIFGQVINGEMYLNDFGEIVKNCWQQLPFHYSRLKLDTFVIMPNHIHGILVLEDFHQIDGRFETLDS